MKYNYKELMAQDPTKLNEVPFINSFKQEIDFYENPLCGDESPVIAVYHEHELAYDTEFYDLDNFYEDSDYNPVLVYAGIFCEYEFKD